MDAYLVMVRGGMDDVPVRLFPDRDTAVSYARSLTDERAQALTVGWIANDKGRGITPSQVTVVRFEGGSRREDFQVKDFFGPVLERELRNLPPPEDVEGSGQIGEGE